MFKTSQIHQKLTPNIRSLRISIGWGYVLFLTWRLSSLFLSFSFFLSRPVLRSPYKGTSVEKMYVISFPRNHFVRTKYVISFPRNRERNNIFRSNEMISRERNNIHFFHRCPLRGSVPLNLELPNLKSLDQICQEGFCSILALYDLLEPLPWHFCLP